MASFLGAPVGVAVWVCGLAVYARPPNQEASEYDDVAYWGLPLFTFAGVLFGWALFTFGTLLQRLIYRIRMWCYRYATQQLD